MARLTLDQWSSVRAKREAGASFPALAKDFGVSHQAIQKRAKAEGWGDGSDVEDVIRRKVAEKVAGLVATENPAKKAEALDAEAEKRAAVVTRHRREWEQVVGLRQEALQVRQSDPSAAFGRARLAKITAEMTKIQQDGERKAWGLDAVDGDGAKGSMNITIKRESAVDADGF
ncbi:MAG: hypothetical protein JNJ81_11190 [Candidatus Accumulibacter sp.]|nr:hypothetical protein [Accumulibacter sp.]